MHHAVDGSQRFATRARVADVGFGEAKPSAADLAQQLEVLALSFRVVERIEVVDREDSVASREQTLTEMRTDEAGAAGDEDACHVVFSCARTKPRVVPVLSGLAWQLYAQ